jgi:hypothetical protein
MNFIRGAAAVALGAGLAGVSYAEDHISVLPSPSIATATEKPSPTGQPSVNCQVVMVGNFRPFDFWTKLKLGTAYYVNPKLVQNSSISYLYATTSDGQSPETGKIFLNDLASGKVTLAQRQLSGTIFVFSPDKAQQIVRAASGEVTKEIGTNHDQSSNGAFTKAVLAQLGRSKFEIASASSDVNGVEPSQAVVSFDALTWLDCPTPK